MLNFQSGFDYIKKTAIAEKIADAGDIDDVVTEKVVQALKQKKAAPVFIEPPKAPEGESE